MIIVELKVKASHHTVSFYHVSNRRLTYKDSGVDIAAGNQLVEMIKPLAKSTARPGNFFSSHR